MHHLREGSWREFWGRKRQSVRVFFLEAQCQDALFYFQTSTRRSLVAEVNMRISMRRMRLVSSWWIQHERRKRRTRGTECDLHR